MGENTRNEAKRQDTSSTLQVHVILLLNGTRRYTPKHQCFSLFDYAVRELGYTDAAAQRRIQAMRLCRRHEWVRAKLQSGELNLTSAAQLETVFAGAERQSRMGRQNGGPGRCHEPEQDDDPGGRSERLRRPRRPALQGEAGGGTESGRSLGKQPRDAGGLEAGERMASAMATAAPGASGAVPFGEPVAFSGRSAPTGVQPAGRLDVRAATGRAAPQSVPGRAPRAEQCSGDAAAANTPVVEVASHAVAQDRGAGHAGALLPRPGLDGNGSPFPAPSCASVPAAPSSDEGAAPQHLPPTNIPAPVPVPVAAPSESRHLASLTPESSRDDPSAELSPGPLSAAPLLHPQRQRELIEQAAGMSTRQVAGLLAAAAPEVVPPRDTLRAVAPDRYTLKVSIDQECEQGLRRLKELLSHLDPRMSWGELVARLVREAVARHDPRGGGNGQRRRAGSAGASARRAPNKRRAAGAAAGPAQRVNESSGRAPNRTRAAGAPAAPAQRGGGDTPAPQGDTAAAGRHNPSAMLASAAPPSQSAPAALSDGARAGGVPSAASAALSDARAGGVPSAAHDAPSAPQFAAGASADGSHGGAGVPVSPEPALGVFSDGGPHGASAGTAAHTTRDSVHSSHQSPPRRHIPAAVRRQVWQRDGGRCCYRDPLTGRRCTSSHLLQIDHLLPVAQGGGPEPSNLQLACFAHHRMRHGHGPAPPPEPPK